MLLHYLTTALRLLWRERGYAAVTRAATLDGDGYLVANSHPAMHAHL